MYSSVPSPPAPWNPGPAPALEHTPPTPVSPSSPTRSGRLRGLSYLRTYTQNHILSRDSHNNNNTNNNQRPTNLTRATSYPSPTSSRGSAPSSPAPPNNTRPTLPTAQRSTTEIPPARANTQENPGSTSGWLPTVGGQSGVSRIATQPQSTDTESSAAVLSGNISSTGVASDLTASMGRTRSATASGALDLPPSASQGQSEVLGNHSTNGTPATAGMPHQLPSIRFTAHQDPRAQRPSLVFSPMARILPSGKEVIKVGRYSERDTQPVHAVNVPSAAPVGFKSKVVSRRHCEFWYSAGKWYIKDVKSSSGTFLNHIRLSSPGTESRPFPVNDGDIVQLGIDFKGGEEMIFRCVKIRVELNKGWQTGPSSFNVQSHKRLQELNNHGKTPASGSSQDCSICLGPIAPCQSLFVAPCSHTWHYKCIRVIINGPHWPHFICPNCRTVADLEAELDDPFANGEWEEVEAEADAPAPATEIEASTQTSNPAPPRIARSPEIPEEVGVMVEAVSEPEHSSPSDIDLAEASDDSGASHGMHQVSSEIGYMRIEDSPRSSASLDPHPLQSNATSAPVDIISRKPVATSSSTPSNRLDQPGTTPDRRLTRTPSPNGLGADLHEVLTNGHEGPMTPRNDAGPFVFDGGAGRASDAQLASAVSMNLNAAASTPLSPSTSSSTPQPTI